MRADDIVISTYPKCGTTWTQRIVGMMVFGSAAPFPVQDISPWPDFRVPPPGAMHELAASQEHRRFLKSHLPFDALPYYEEVKYMHVARDGRDAAMSFFNHKANYTPEVNERFVEISNDDPKFGDGDSFDFSPQDAADQFAGWVDGPEDELGDPGAGGIGEAGAILSSTRAQTAAGKVYAASKILRATRPRRRLNLAPHWRRGVSTVGW